MNKLSVVIITKNEASNIVRCLASVNWADEVLVVDTGSTDATIELCHKYAVTVQSVPWQGFGTTKHKAVELATHNWILSVDADEEISPALHTQIQDTLNHPKKDGYRIKRSSMYLGKTIKHAGWNRDYPLRLFNREKGNFNHKDVHESVEIDGKIGKIQALMHHYTYPDYATHINKMNLYSDIGAASLAKKGKKSQPTVAFWRAVSKFFKMYILQLAFLDGKHGFILAFSSGFGVYMKYIKLWHLQKRENEGSTR